MEFTGGISPSRHRRVLGPWAVSPALKEDYAEEDKRFRVLGNEHIDLCTIDQFPTSELHSQPQNDIISSESLQYMFFFSKQN